jgi:hypothetical protein
MSLRAFMLHCMIMFAVFELPLDARLAAGNRMMLPRLVDKNIELQPDVVWLIIVLSR